MCQISLAPMYEDTFVSLKEKLILSIYLVIFHLSQHLILATDSSHFDLVEVLAHCLAYGSEFPIAFTSKTLTSYQSKYSQIEKETLAIVFVLKMFCVFLYGTKFHLITGHKLLV